MRIRMALLGLASVLLLGCADEEDAPSVSSAEPSPDVTAVESTAGTPVQCTTDAVATFPGAGEVPLLDGKAVPLGGPAYTIFAGDYDVPSEGIAIAGAQAGPGQHLAFVATTVYNSTGPATELEIGVPIEWTDEFEVLTFAVLLDEEGETHGNNIGAAGTLTVTALDDSSICVEVDYSDDEKSVVGTISAEIV
jgi:hypothetical protein